VDSLDGSPAVVKLVSASGVSSAVRLRLEHEARVLGQLDLACRPVAVGADGSDMYLAQSYVEGVTLEQRLLDGPLSVESTLTAGIEVLSVLAQAHERGVIHRDVKPANIIVEREGPLGRVVLIDFGLARSAWLDAEIRDEPVGTARYIAPETAGLVDAEVDERADLYSTGVVLYECLAGRAPFEGATVGEVLQAHASADPAPLRAGRRDIPGALDALIHRLLAKDPAERYQSASAVVADLETLKESLASGVADPPVAIGLTDRRRSLTEAGFIGRSSELATLVSVMQDPERPHGLVFVEAESGGGKSRMLDELCLGLDRSITVLRGQGVDRVALRPFQILDGVTAGIHRLCEADTAIAADLVGRLNGWRDAVAGVLPVLGDALGVEPSGDGPEAFGEGRTLNALCSLFDAVATIGRRFVIVLDDAQWADTLTFKLLAEWAQPGRVPAGSQLIVVVAFRTEEVQADHPLRSMTTMAHLRLAPLAAGEIEALCESMAGPLPEDATAAIERLADGSPFMAAAVLRGLVESGALEYYENGWRLDPGALADAQTSRRAGIFLSHRLQLLSDAARHLLGAGAVLGKTFDLDAALGLADIHRASAAAALEESRRRRVVWVDERSGSCTFAHDKLRETLLEQMAPDLRRELHRLVADKLTAQRPTPEFEIAYHYDAGGSPEAAFPYAMNAARTARRRHALDVSVAQYRIAERGASSVDGDTKRQMYEGLGEVLGLVGDYDGAEANLKHALDLAVDAMDRSSLEGKLGDVAFRRGDQVAARGYVEGALRQLGRWVPRSRIGFLLGAIWEILVQAAHSAFPGRLGQRSPVGAEGEFLAARLYSRLAYIFWFTSGRIPCAWTHLREMNLAERYPPSPELAQAWSEHAPVMTMIPWYSRGIAYARKSYDVRVELGDEWGQGQSLSFYGVVLYAASRYRECIDACYRAVDLLSRMGDRWEENTATWHIAFSHYRLGELPQAVEICRRVHTRAAAIGDQSSRGIALSGWSRAAEGNIPADLIAAEIALGTEDAHTSSEIRLAETVRLINLGDWSGACKAVDEALGIIRASGLRQEYVAPAYAWSATARRGMVDALPSTDGRGRKRTLRQARRASRRALLEARWYRNNLPHALREAGLVSAMSGRQSKGSRLLARSIGEAERQGARYELALSHAAALGLAASAPTAVPRPAAAPAVAPQEEAWTFSLADRFNALLEVSREISSAPSVPTIYEAVRHASTRLLRGDGCHIIQLGDVDDVEQVQQTESGNPLERISRALIRRAVEAGEPVLAGESLAEDSSESLVLSNARSSLCAPIYCEGRAIAVIYVVSRHLAGLFGEQEQQLASFITNLAGAALEHVAGSEARFRSLVQNSSDVTTVVDFEGRITYVSASVTAVFGIDPESLIGQSILEWVHPDDGPELILQLRAPSAEPVAPSLVKYRLSDAIATWRHVETAMTDMRDDPGVRGIVLNTRDVSERVALEEELRHRAWHDVVTGLANRALFTERVDHARARSSRRPGSFAVLFLDLDDFKSINDTLGHATGDLVLRAVAEKLSACVRPDDTVARFGGDEFALLLEGADGEQAAAVCERILASLSDPIDVRGRLLEAQASIGMVLSDAAQGSEGLLAAADAALYVAKARGKRRFEAFEPSMRSAAVARAGLRTELDQALARSELRIAYQPVISLQTGEVSGFEALLRWVRPHGMVLSPDQFIPLAEESGVIVPIGAWVLEMACAQAMAWQEMTGRPLTMAVNLSGRQLLHPRIIDDVRDVLARTGMDPASLVLEITESTTVQESETVVGKLHALKELGVGLAIDDFGTGYSALSYLRRLPVDIIKVDRSFVSGLGRNPEDVAIIQTVISLANALHLDTVAEGVETLDQLEILHRLGCQLAQGYNWKRPSPAEDISAWLLHPPALGLATYPSVLIVDDSRGLRSALRVAIEIDGRFEVAGEAADAAEAVSEASRVKPDFVLLDLKMPGTDGQDVLPRLLEVSPASQVLILSAADPSEIPAAALLWSKGVLDKTRDFAAVVDRLQELTVDR
jgi:diguanylate cyclase (GGDEF)-like protein/PAS domain S-box-containing protein